MYDNIYLMHNVNIKPIQGCHVALEILKDLF